MPWQNLTLTIPVILAETLESRLEVAGAISISLADAGDDPVLEPGPGEMPLWPEITLTALFKNDEDLGPLASSLRAEFGLAQDPSITALPDQEWTRAWMSDFKPMRFGDRTWVCPSWCTPPDPNAINLRLDPGLAFGTGTHPTTALCLAWLDQYLKPGVRVLDYGCGSGILAIAALLLGAQEAWAIDIDPQALLATRENARRNEIADEHLHIGQPNELATGPFDVVIANILSGPLIELADTLCDQIKPGGHLLLSGILEDQADKTARAYASRVAWDPPTFQEGWARLSGRLIPS